MRWCLESTAAAFYASEARLPTGRIQVQFVIEADGKVRHAALEIDSVGSPALACCVLSKMRTFRFPKPNGGGVVIVTYPFVFEWI